ncbi:tetratricopeptide repeat protein [Vampirovibrio chlorellavorus]|uniref:tetratricopeptide repeat protein n=1 Tax=Vampirovibrio chlorellavorus TaxID=758823 RepID=UPI0026EE856C|nr:tetratricopeptide repeat protein [Vampirovibrio chlorellavorus]
MKIIAVFKSYSAVFPLGVACAAVVMLLAAAPAHADAYQLGLNLYTQGNYAGAIRYFLDSVAQNSLNANAHYYLADSYLKLNRFAEAQAEYQKILTLAPDSQAARLSRVGLSRLRLYTESSNSRQWRLSGETGGAKADRYEGVIPKGGDYLDNATEGGKRVRWALSRLPLRVYIEESPLGIRNFQPGFVAEVRRGLDVWCAALENQLSYTQVTSKEQADIRVSWVNNIDSQAYNEEGRTAYTAGLMTPHYQGDRIDYMDVKIATFDILGKPQSGEQIHAVAVHELGHSLGLMGHSDQPGDIMYSENRSVIKPSLRDVITIRRLYTLAADINNLSPEQREVTTERVQELANAQEKALGRLERTVEQSGTPLNYLNLGVGYYQKALQAIQKGENARPWLEKALQAIDKTIEMQPKDPRAYHRRSLVHQELGDFDSAFGDIQRAITYDRSEPEYLMLKAWYLSQLNRKGEARGALDAYLLAKPSAAGSAEVKRIQQALVNKV